VTSFAWQRGLHTGSRAWLYFGAGMQGVRLLGRVTSSKPEIYRLKLRPGDAIEIREVPRVQ
jgi:hypothetical protein